jgi:hypothetical protein
LADFFKSTPLKLLGQMNRNLVVKNADRKFDMESKDINYQNKNSKIWMLAHFDPLISWKQ